MKNFDVKGCRCCGKIFPYVTKQHVPVEFDDAYFERYNGPTSDLIELDGMDATLTVGYLDEQHTLRADRARRERDARSNRHGISLSESSQCTLQ